MRKHWALRELLFRSWSTRVVDDEQPRAIRLLSHHFRTQTFRCRLGVGCRALDYPLAVQKRKTGTRFYDRARCQAHLNTNRKYGVKRCPYVLASCYLISVDHQNRVGFIQRNQRLYVTNVECVLEQSMKFGWAMRSHHRKWYTASITPAKRRRVDSSVAAGFVNAGRLGGTNWRG